MNFKLIKMNFLEVLQLFLSKNIQIPKQLDHLKTYSWILTTLKILKLFYEWKLCNTELFCSSKVLPSPRASHATINESDADISLENMTTIIIEIYYEQYMFDLLFIWTCSPRMCTYNYHNNHLLDSINGNL
jgi:hypothetical protein